MRTAWGQHRGRKRKINWRNQRIGLTRTDGSYYTNNYDNIGQLKWADSTVNTEDRGYLYDAAWNLNVRTNNGVTGTFTVDNKNQLTTIPGGSCLYDSNGNLTSDPSRTLSYDDENRLTQVIYPNSYRIDLVYDGRLRLRKRTEYTWNGSSWTLAGEYRYIYDGMRVIQERDSGNNPTVGYTRGIDLSASLEGAGGIGGLLARSHGYSGGSWTTLQFYHADGLGNITAMVDSSQTISASYRYDPFGSLISSSGAMSSVNMYRYSSKEWLFYTNLYYYGYRFYDSSLQRWLNRDPIHEVGFLTLKGRKHGWHQNAEVNLYVLVRNDAVNSIDPLGLTEWGPLGGGCCNKTKYDEWWLDDGVWKKLPPGKCTGVFDDCDGMTCNGRFYAVGNIGRMNCEPNPPKTPPGGWTPCSTDDPSGPKSPPDRGAPNNDPPPGYDWHRDRPK